MRPLLALLLWCGLAALGAAATDKGVNVLDEATYDAFAAANPLMLVQFYAPWCGHSRALQPEYEAAAALLSGVLPLAKVDATVAEKLATKLDVKGYPTIFFVRDGVSDEYHGERTRDAIHRWALAKHSPKLPLLETPSAFSEWTAGKRVAPVLFVDAPLDASSDVYKAMLGVAGALDVECAVSTSPPEASMRGALVVFKAFDEAHAIHRGPLERLAIERFVRTESLPWLVSYSAAMEESIFSSDALLQAFFLHGADLSAAAAAALSSAAQQLRGKVVFSHLDVSDGSPAAAELADFFDVAPSGSLTPPTLAAFSLSSGSKFVHPGAIEASAIVEFVNSVLAGEIEPHLRSQPEPEQHGPVVELVGSTYADVVNDATKDVFVQFYAPDCGHCRKLAPVWTSLAEKLSSDAEIVVARIDATKNDVAGIEPEGFPTLLFFPKNNKQGVEYDGSRDEFDLVQFVNDVREGKEHIGGLPEFEESVEEGKVEL